MKILLGESDAHRPYSIEYNCTFPAMIDDWRSKWAENSGTDPKFPFGFVMLSVWGDKNNQTCGNNECGPAEVRWVCKIRK